MRYFKIRVDGVVELPDDWDRHRVTDKLADLMVDFVEGLDGSFGGGTSADEVDEDGDPV